MPDIFSDHTVCHRDMDFEASDCNLLRRNAIRRRGHSRSSRVSAQAKSVCVSQPQSLKVNKKDDQRLSVSSISSVFSTASADTTESALPITPRSSFQELYLQDASKSPIRQTVPLKVQHSVHVRKESFQDWYPPDETARPCLPPIKVDLDDFRLIAEQGISPKSVYSQSSLFLSPELSPCETVYDPKETREAKYRLSQLLSKPQKRRSSLKEQDEDVIPIRGESADSLDWLWNRHARFQQWESIESDRLARRRCIDTPLTR